MSGISLYQVSRLSGQADREGYQKLSSANLRGSPSNC